ncbi:PIN domain-containing protein [Candidatus Micrarchaeota archaeon]|nr:PIN domain-containing protein [Candidatus Micrarchaeota archaeon]
MIVLDTSFLISLYLSEDSNHEKAYNQMESNKNEITLLSDLILFETLTVLNYKKGIEFTKEVYRDLITNKNVRNFYFTEKEREDILIKFFEIKQNKLSLQDVSVIYLAKKSNSEILAFDERMIKEVKRW